MGKHMWTVFTQLHNGQCAPVCVTLCEYGPESLSNKHIQSLNGLEKVKQNLRVFTSQKNKEQVSLFLLCFPFSFIHPSQQSFPNTAKMTAKTCTVKRWGGDTAVHRRIMESHTNTEAIKWVTDKQDDTQVFGS